MSFIEWWVLLSLLFLLCWSGQRYLRLRPQQGERNRRILPRFVAEWQVEIDTDQGVQKGVTQNVSGSGMFVVLASPLSLGQVCPVRIQVPGAYTVEGEIEVVWAVGGVQREDQCRAGIGVQFSYLADQDRKLICSFERAN
ncbi:MAG: PilZ domain-containing protein [Desulfuromonadaceae bacterium]